jgi:hypothetical protein
LHCDHLDACSGRSGRSVIDRSADEKGEAESLT